MSVIFKLKWEFQYENRTFFRFWEIRLLSVALATHAAKNTPTPSFTAPSQADGYADSG